MKLSEFTFDHYYTYDEMVEFLESAHKDYPSLTTLESIGKSGEGRDIWAVTITDNKTGDVRKKPAIYIDGNFHAGEVTGSMINLYAIKHVLENYGSDGKVTRLLRENTLYVIPRVSPDGAEVYLTTPETLRSAPRYYPFDNPDELEGLYPADIDGDGHILTMRVKDDTGEWKVSDQDPRAMVRRAPDECEGIFYRVYTEGYVREYDGGEVKQAPSKWGLDFNRNFPFGWVPEVEQSGAGEFPLSEPETRAVAEFVVRHPNISLALTYHTTGGVILRVPGAHPHTQSPRHDIQAMMAIGEMGTEETGYPCVPCYEQYYGGGAGYSKGAYDDWLFDHRGILAYTVETWNLSQRANVHQFPPKEKSSREQQEDYLKMLTWNDRELGGRGFENWRPSNHPQLGQVEIGGWYVKYVVQNAPPSFLEAECHKNSMFLVRAASTLPKIEISSVDSRRVGEGVYEVSAFVRNTGFLPTCGSHRARDLKKARPLTAELLTPTGQVEEKPESESLLNGRRETQTNGGIEVIGKAKKEIEHLDGRSGSTSEFSLWTRSTEANRVAKVTWVVRAGKGAEIRIGVGGDRAGYTEAMLTVE
jgi:murein tripeptide amidase MpaA